MASSEETNPQAFQAFQAFQSHAGKLLASQPTHVCSETGKRYTLWSDIQHAFSGVDHLEDQQKSMIPFMVDNNGLLYDPLKQL